jgi:hypothetical protein
MTACFVQIPKLIVRARFLTPAHARSTGKPAQTADFRCLGWDATIAVMPPEGDVAECFVCRKHREQGSLLPGGPVGEDDVVIVSHLTPDACL